MTRVAVATATLLALAGPAAAQDDGANSQRSDWLTAAGVSGSVRAAYWSSSRALDEEAHLGAWTLRAKSAPPSWRGLSLVAEGWAQAAGPQPADGARGALRELFVNLRSGPVDLRVGRQIIAWGRADGINPTDNLTPSDMTFFAFDDDERRRGTTAAMATFYGGGYAVSAVWIPEFQPHTVSLPVPPGVDVRREGSDWPGDQWAARIDRTGGAVDWSISYFDGRELSPTPAPAFSGSGIRLTHPRARIVGADVATTLGRFGIRAEGAYVASADRRGDDPFVRNPFVLLVAGVDRTWLEYLNINAQYVVRVVRRHAPLPAASNTFDEAIARLDRTLASETRRVQHGATIRIAHQWLHETLEAECSGVATFDPSGFLLRPRVTYAVSDRWAVSAGAEVIGGSRSSTFGLLRDNSTGFAELRWSF